MSAATIVHADAFWATGWYGRRPVEYIREDKPQRKLAKRIYLAGLRRNTAGRLEVERLYEELGVVVAAWERDNHATHQAYVVYGRNPTLVAGWFADGGSFAAIDSPGIELVRSRNDEIERRAMRTPEEHDARLATILESRTEHDAEHDAELARKLAKR